MKGVQCYELFGGIALKNHTFFIFFHSVNYSKMAIENHHGEEDGCSLLPETVCVRTRLRMDITLVSSVGFPLFFGKMQERGQDLRYNRHNSDGFTPELSSRSTPETIPTKDIYARHRRFEIRAFFPICGLSKAIEPLLPACQLYRWHLGLSEWSLPIT